MINRELKNVTVKSYSATPDAYGQMDTGTATSTKTIQAVVKVNNRTNVQDIRYLDIDIVVLSKESVTVSDRLEIDGVNYQISSIIPAYTNRGLNQFLCKQI